MNSDPTAHRPDAGTSFASEATQASTSDSTPAVVPGQDAPAREKDALNAASALARQEELGVTPRALAAAMHSSLSSIFSAAASSFAVAQGS